MASNRIRIDPALRDGGDDPAFLHDVGAVAHSENGVEILFHEQDCGAEFPTEGAKGCTDWTIEG
jgi:hypothetical protein